MGRGRASAEFTDVDHQPVGIYGWRKRCLYAFVLFLLVLMILNLAVTIWILRVLDFSIDGMGKLRITNHGFRMEGEAEFVQPLYTSEIHSRTKEPLYIESSRNINIHARDKKFKVSNSFLIGDKKVEALCESFEVRDYNTNKTKFLVTDDKVVIGVDEVKLTGNKATFTGSVVTASLRGPISESLSLESSTSSIKISGHEGVAVMASAGNVELKSSDSIKIQSDKNITLDSRTLFFENMRVSQPRNKGRTFHGVYQLCVCQNGRLFLSAPNGDCRATADICS